MEDQLRYDVLKTLHGDPNLRVLTAPQQPVQGKFGELSVTGFEPRTMCHLLGPHFLVFTLTNLATLAGIWCTNYIYKNLHFENNQWQCPLTMNPLSHWQSEFLLTKQKINKMKNKRAGPHQDIMFNQIDKMRITQRDLFWSLRAKSLWESNTSFM